MIYFYEIIEILKKHTGIELVRGFLGSIFYYAIKEKIIPEKTYLLRLNFIIYFNLIFYIIIVVSKKYFGIKLMLDFVSIYYFII